MEQEKNNEIIILLQRMNEKMEKMTQELSDALKNVRSDEKRN